MFCTSIDTGWLPGNPPLLEKMSNYDIHGYHKIRLQAYQLNIAGYKEKSQIYNSPFDIAHRRDSKSDFMQQKEKVNFRFPKLENKQIQLVNIIFTDEPGMKILTFLWK